MDARSRILDSACQVLPSFAVSKGFSRVYTGHHAPSAKHPWSFQGRAKPRNLDLPGSCCKTEPAHRCGLMLACTRCSGTPVSRRNAGANMRDSRGPPGNTARTAGAPLGSRSAYVWGPGGVSDRIRPPGSNSPGLILTTHLRECKAWSRDVDLLASRTRDGRTQGKLRDNGDRGCLTRNTNCSFGMSASGPQTILDTREMDQSLKNGLSGKFKGSRQYRVPRKLFKN
ncbi:hypothetical protein LZ30DRAFT_704865 [Colletotrichum cereale]|nr:hypothetical protein LZ30DRAFT_704865 [Colletotrichum cereale]